MRTLALVCILSATTAVPAQPAKNRTPFSPEVRPDRTVTFRVRAPKATEVTLTADWQASGVEKMTRDDAGVWSITVGPLVPGPAIYNFNIDGVAVPDPINPRVKLRARTSASIVDVPGDGTELWNPGMVPHGRVELVYVRSKAALPGQTREVRVYTPPGYDKDSAHKYPVMYLLHGSNDTAAGWTDVGRANFILDNLIAQKKAVPMLVVMPFGHALPFGGPGDNTKVFEQHLLEDVMPLVEKTFRTTAGRENRAIVGLSMGGGQALTIGLGHLELFSHVGAFSAAVPGNFSTRFKALLDDPAGTNAKLKVLFVACGKQDSLFARSQQLDKTLAAHKIDHTFYPTEGRHNFAVWRQYLGQIAPMLFREAGK
ncbi:MAG TPA: alpha/beta hydrolase-fold protein [Fimbriiglobus sp.]|jgi:enterochelin esterase family protein